MSGDYTNTPEWKAWEANVHEQLIPQLRSSGAVAQIVPRGDTDVKFAVELGFSIMMNKPILAMVQPGSEVPEKLRLVADVIVEVDLDSEVGRREAHEKIREFLDSLPED